MGDPRKITREYFDSLLLEQRLLGSDLPDTKAEFLGITFDSPIMTAALSHLGPSEHGLKTGICEYAAGAAKANVLHWVGMCENHEFEEVMAMGAKTIRIIKPYADEEKVLSQIECCKRLGTVACGIDIDHSFTGNGEYDICMGEVLNQKSVERIMEYMRAADMPYIIKGILSVQDAVQAAQMGVYGIVVSHHNGRMQDMVPPLYLLPAIKAAVGDKVKIFVDCGVTNGLDAYKALALGADGVSVGTALMPMVKEGGSEAVAQRIREMNAQLKGFMAFTGVRDTTKFDPTVIHHRTW